MIYAARQSSILQNSDLNLLYENSENKLLIFQRAGLLFTFNFHPHRSYSDYRFEAPEGKYKLLLNSDAPQYGGHRRLIENQEHLTCRADIVGRKSTFLSLYLPSRTAQVYQFL